MAKFIKYPSIGQFQNLVDGLLRRLTYAGRDENDEPIYDDDRPIEPIRFKGTVKLHGTNGSFAFQGDEFWLQKRSDIVTPTADNYGFASFYAGADNAERIKRLGQQVRDKFSIPKDTILVIYGEWVGKGVHNVGVSKLDKAFYIFAIKTIVGEGESAIVRWYPIEGFRDHSLRIFNLEDYETYEIELDLRKPELVKDRLREITQRVEDECPVAKALGVNNGVGEGVVWKTVIDNEVHAFKVKGEKHASSGGKGAKEKIALDPAVVANINEFVDYAVTANRLEQGFDELFTGPGIKPSRKNTGDFIKWVTGDVFKEEIDTMAQNGQTVKDVAPHVSTKARKWFFERIDGV